MAWIELDQSPSDKVSTRHAQAPGKLGNAKDASLFRLTCHTAHQSWYRSRQRPRGSRSNHTARKRSGYWLCKESGKNCCCGNAGNVTTALLMMRSASTNNTRPALFKLDASRQLIHRIIGSSESAVTLVSSSSTISMAPKIVALWRSCLQLNHLLHRLFGTVAKCLLTPSLPVSAGW